MEVEWQMRTDGLIRYDRPEDPLRVLDKFLEAPSCSSFISSATGGTWRLIFGCLEAPRLDLGLLVL